MKKLIITTFILAILLSVTAFAGDPECLMMYGNQELLIVGEIIDINQDIFTLEVSHKLQGECNDLLKIKAFKKYWMIPNEPNVGDYCVISLNKMESMYIIEHGVYKTDTGDYKKLKTIKREGEPGEAALTTIDWFVNSDGEYKDFFSISSRTYLKKENGEEIQIFPKIIEDKEDNSNIKVNKELENSDEYRAEIINEEKGENNKKQKNDFILSLMILVIFGGIFLIFKNSNKLP